MSILKSLTRKSLALVIAFSFVFSGVFFTVSTMQADGPTEITECGTITESGSYVLINNIVDVEGDCITIEADDVEIDGAEYSISALEEQGGAGIFAQGYDRIVIRNITLDGFYDGIVLVNVQGPSEIVDSVFTNMINNGIRGNGVTELTIRANLITAIQGDGIYIGRFYDDSEEEWIKNSDITITGNTISEIDSDGIEVRWVSEAVITNNDISDVDSDGIYVRNGTNVTVSENVIDNVGSDGIDFSHDEEHDDVNSNIVITNNTLTNIGDHGIELDEVHGGVVTGNSIDTTTRNGIDVDESTDIVITNNTLTNIGQDGIELDGVSGATITGNSLQVGGKGIEADDSDNIVASNNTITPTNSLWLQTLSGDDESFTYTLPFTLNFFGRDIVAIEVNTNGSVELLEEDENCQVCDEYGSYNSYFDNDIIFASFDDLRTDTSSNDFVGVQYDENNNRVIVEWFGSNYYEGDSEEYPLHFQVVIYANGDIQWNFNQMDFDDFGYAMFSGMYDYEAGDLYVAGFEIAEQVSYKANFSDQSTTIFAPYDSEEVEGYQIPETDFEFFVPEGGAPVSIIGLDLDFVSNSSFIGNSIRAGKWVRTQGEIENVVFNNSNSGNTYYFSNGAGAWTQFDIIDSTGNGYADKGADRPFNEAKLGTDLWDGEGQDLYPGTETRSAATQTKSRSSSGGRASPALLAQLGITLANQPVVPVPTPIDTVCPADQILTQDLRKGARNGRFHPYTKGIVTQANILQAHLNRLGFNSGPADGILGPISDGAIKRMQTFLGTKADGFVGPITRGLLNNSCGSGGLQG